MKVACVQHWHSIELSSAAGKQAAKSCRLTLLSEHGVLLVYDASVIIPSTNVLLDWMKPYCHDSEQNIHQMLIKNVNLAHKSWWHLSHWKSVNTCVRVQSCACRSQECLSSSSSSSSGLLSPICKLKSSRWDGKNVFPLLSLLTHCEISGAYWIF